MKETHSAPTWGIDKRKTTDSQEYGVVADHLYHLMKESGEDRSLPKSEGAFLTNLLEHIKVILCNLHCASYTDPNLWIAFQRAGIANKQDRTKKGFQFSHSNIKRVSDFLHRQGFIEMVIGKPGYKGTRGEMSRMQATPKLLDLLESFHADTATIYRDTSTRETVVMKGEKIPPTKAELEKSPDAKPKRKIVKTPDKPAVRQMRADLKTINNVLISSRIELDISGDELEELNEDLSKDPNKYKVAVDFTRKTIYRVFVDRSFDRYGRFHGGWWENIPELTRERILINGVPTVELDYKAIHPHILYGMEGVEPRMSDPYHLDGFSPEKNTELRPLLKRFFLVMLNASSERGAIQVLRDKYKEEAEREQVLQARWATRWGDRPGKPFQPPPFKINADNMKPIIQQLRTQHEPVAHHFFTGVGNTLMNHDSDIAMEVMLHFARQKIPCLPVHDSFIVDVRYAWDCWDAMKQAFHFRFGFQIPIDVIDGLEQAKKILAGPQVLKGSSEWSGKRF